MYSLKICTVHALLLHNNTGEDTGRFFAITQRCTEAFLLPGPGQLGEGEERPRFCDGQLADHPSVELNAALLIKRPDVTLVAKSNEIQYQSFHIYSGFPKTTVLGFDLVTIEFEYLKRSTFVRLLMRTGYFMPCSREAAAMRAIQS